MRRPDTRPRQDEWGAEAGLVNRGAVGYYVVSNGLPVVVYADIRSNIMLLQSVLTVCVYICEELPPSGEAEWLDTRQPVPAATNVHTSLRLVHQINTYIVGCVDCE